MALTNRDRLFLVSLARLIIMGVVAFPSWRSWNKEGGKVFNDLALELLEKYGTD